MIFDQLTDAEKVYWLNYLIRMEDRHAQQAQQLERGVSAAMHPRRRALLQEAHVFYQHFYGQIKTALWPSVSKEALLQPEVLDYKYDAISAFSIGYLGRDWGEGAEHQEQQQICQLIEQELQGLPIERSGETALFLGCGLGRYAVDLAPHYQQVEAFDASLLMIWCIEHLMQVDQWEVLLKAERNCRRIEDTIEAYTIAIAPEQKALIREKVHFFVANAKNIPLPDQSVQHLYSIYFTDVLPLTELYQSIERLLLPEGLFIHFGPLEYFFNDEREMLTAEEVRLFFEHQGYTIHTDRFFPSKHLALANSMRHRVYDNWFFIAQRPQQPAVAPLHVQVILGLNPNSQLSSQAQLAKGKVASIDYQIQRGSVHYELPEIVYKILLALDGKQSLAAIFEALDLKDLHPDDAAQLLTILQELLDQNLLQLIQ